MQKPRYLEKAVMQGKMKGKKRGHPTAWWKDSITETMDTLMQKSPTPGPTTGLWPISNRATRVVGRSSCMQLNLREQWASGHSCSCASSPLM